MPRARRRRILASLSFKRYTDNTITDIATIEAQLEHIARTRVGVNNEEFLPGLFCIAVLVPRPGGRSNTGIAIQAPVMRVSSDKALRFLPALKRAANAIAAIDADAMPASKTAA